MMALNEMSGHLSSTPFGSPLVHTLCLIPTWPKVNCGIETLYGATFEVVKPSTICGEKHHLLIQVRAEQLGQVTHVVVITGEVTSVFVLHLPNADMSGGRSASNCLQCSQKLHTHLYSDNGTAVLIQIRLHHWE